MVITVFMDPRENVLLFRGQSFTYGEDQWGYNAVCAKMESMFYIFFVLIVLITPLPLVKITN